MPYKRSSSFGYKFLRWHCSCLIQRIEIQAYWAVEQEQAAAAQDIQVLIFEEHYSNRQCSPSHQWKTFCLAQGSLRRSLLGECQEQYRMIEPLWRGCPAVAARIVLLQAKTERLYIVMETHQKEEVAALDVSETNLWHSSREAPGSL